MAMKYRTSIRTAMVDLVNTGMTGTSRILIFSGTAPALTAAGNSTGTLLATLTPAGTFGSSTSGVLTAGAIASATAVASGTPTFARGIDGTSDDGTHTQWQCDAAVGSGSLNFASAITSGGTVSISSWVLSEGNP